MVEFLIQTCDDAANTVNHVKRTMRCLTVIILLGLSACVGEDLGQSRYLDDPFVASPQQQVVFNSQQAEADRRLAASLADEAARQTMIAQSPPSSVFSTDADGNVVLKRQPLQVGTDAALVASLEAAIDSAGSQEPVEPPQSAPQTVDAAEPGAQVEPPVQVAAAPQIPATQPPIAVREGQVTDEGGATSAAADPTISDNSFNSVTQRETIESDAERLEALSQERIVLEAEPLPSPTSQANLAAFARETQHRIGQRVYPRGSSRSTSAAARTCRTYGNSDEAQRAFLAAGGPQKDPMKLDPDGDGFVCGWSPEPFRSLRLGSG